MLLSMSCQKQKQMQKTEILKGYNISTGVEAMNHAAQLQQRCLVRQVIAGV